MPIDLICEPNCVSRTRISGHIGNSCIYIDPICHLAITSARNHYT